MPYVIQARRGEEIRAWFDARTHFCISTPHGSLRWLVGLLDIEPCCILLGNDRSKELLPSIPQYGRCFHPCIGSQTILAAEKQIEHHGLILANDGSTTRRPSGEGQNALPGVIDLTLAMTRIAHRVTGWKTLKEDGEVTASDHEIIEWCYNSEERDVDREHLVRG
jgi:hypothetical protein